MYILVMAVLINGGTSPIILDFWYVFLFFLVHAIK